MGVFWGASQGVLFGFKNCPSGSLKNIMKASQKFEIVSFYKFLPLASSRLPYIKKKLLEQTGSLYGLVLLSTEGINATLSGPKGGLSSFLEKIKKLLSTKEDFFYKKSLSPVKGFKKLRVKIKKEIITMDQKNFKALKPSLFLEPGEWEKEQQKSGTQVLDIRNDYEVRLGKFKKATHLNLKEFSRFPQSLKTAALDKNKKTLIYCTGGIRCEKALSEMKRQGFQKVYSLKGGIIHYLKKYPYKSFEGDCFVFDHRVALNQEGRVCEKYRLCPHCGDAAAHSVSCLHCGRKILICRACLNKKENRLKTCGKNCSHHFQMGHRCKKPFKTSEKNK